jgi:3-oxoacyl-[acyl-carrier protein] reductase
MMKVNLKGKVAIVTGSSRGIGRASALALAKEGINVVVNYLEHEKEAEETVDVILKMDCQSLKVQADVCKVDDVLKMVEIAMKTFGRIDILVNNAGIVRDRTLLKMEPIEWENVLATNLTGIFNCTKAVLETMLKQKSGRIINISSVVGQRGNFGQTNYAASKAGIIGFTKSLARELASKGITVNAIAPGFTETSLVKNLPEKVKTQLLEQIPMRRFAKPAEIAAVVVFLASDASSYVTGQVINVNGGMYM